MTDKIAGTKYTELKVGDNFVEKFRLTILKVLKKIYAYVNSRDERFAKFKKSSKILKNIKIFNLIFLLNFQA